MLKRRYIANRVGDFIFVRSILGSGSCVKSKLYNPKTGSALECVGFPGSKVVGVTTYAKWISLLGRPIGNNNFIKLSFDTVSRVKPFLMKGE